jgi:hypothetical protein
VRPSRDTKASLSNRVKKRVLFCKDREIIDYRDFDRGDADKSILDDLGAAFREPADGIDLAYVSGEVFALFNG